MSTCPYAAVAAARNAKCGVRIAFTVCGVEDLELSVSISDTTILTLPPSLGIEMDAAIRSGTKTLAELLESVYDAISPSLSQMAVGVGMLQQFRAQCLFEGGGQPSSEEIHVRMSCHLPPPLTAPDSVDGDVIRRFGNTSNPLFSFTPRGTCI